MTLTKFTFGLIVVAVLGVAGLVAAKPDGGASKQNTGDPGASPTPTPIPELVFHSHPTWADPTFIKGRSDKVLRVAVAAVSRPNLLQPHLDPNKTNEFWYNGAHYRDVTTTVLESIKNGPPVGSTYTFRVLDRVDNVQVDDMVPELNVGVELIVFIDTDLNADYPGDWQIAPYEFWVVDRDVLPAEVFRNTDSSQGQTYSREPLQGFLLRLY